MTFRTGPPDGVLILTCAVVSGTSPTTHHKWIGHVLSPSRPESHGQDGGTQCLVRFVRVLRFPSRSSTLGLIGLLTLILSVISFRQRRAANAIENERVASLVQIALDLLRNQELAHHTDPITAPQPFLSSLQLRDLVLQDEHSVNARRKLWERVERVVEGNANVRTNLEEVEGGDEMRVWRWVGSAGKTLPSIPGSSRMVQHTSVVETSTN